MVDDFSLSIIQSVLDSVKVSTIHREHCQFIGTVLKHCLYKVQCSDNLDILINAGSALSPIC